MEEKDEIQGKTNLEDNNIELRSEKARNIIGQMPPFLFRWGNTILIVIFILLLVIIVLYIKSDLYMLDLYMTTDSQTISHIS